MNVWTTPLSINIYENWLWHKSVLCASARCNGRWNWIAHSPNSSLNQKLLLLLLHIALEIAWLLLLLHLKRTGLSSAINSIYIYCLRCGEFCIDDYCGCMKCGKRNLCKENYKSLVLLSAAARTDERCNNDTYTQIDHQSSASSLSERGRHETLDILFSAIYLYTISNTKLWAVGHRVGNRFDFNEFKLIVFVHTHTHTLLAATVADIYREKSHKVAASLHQQIAKASQRDICAPNHARQCNNFPAQDCNQDVNCLAHFCFHRARHDRVYMCVVNFHFLLSFPFFSQPTTHTFCTRLVLT